jgi:hypothetical protein
MLPRMAFGLGLAFGLVLAGPGLAVVGGRLSAQQSQLLGSQEERINRRQALDIEVQRETRDRAERTELTRRLVADDADAATGLATQRKLRECQQMRRFSEQGLSHSAADTRRRCTPDIQLWSKTGDGGGALASS